MAMMQASRPADDLVIMPYTRLCEVANQEAQQAEVILLRRLLQRAYGLLQNEATRARTCGMRDASIEGLMLDISATLDKPPTLV